ncbi:bifunctional hydroxymethylpyrimidine kinase/phosphomethylpyrimidine kinase [Yoonia sp. MH D7]
MVFQALTIAGSDSGGGAGIQADLKTFSALGVYGASVITAITAQNTRAVMAVEILTPAMVRAQMDAVFDDLTINAIKVGMLGSAETINAVANGLVRCAVPVVLDPVMVAKSGDVLLADAAVVALRTRMLPLADLVTPNLPEAAQLLDAPEAASEAEMLEQGRALLALGPRAVLMKGGHASGTECVDLLITAQDVLRLSAPRHPTHNTHGTGCTLSAAIAAKLARGMLLPEAVQAAHAYLQNAIAAADQLNIGSGNGPVHHFHAVWRDE